MNHSHRWRLSDAGQSPQSATPGTCVECGDTRTFTGGVAGDSGPHAWKDSEEERLRRIELSAKRSEMVRRSWEKRRTG